MHGLKLLLKVVIPAATAQGKNATYEARQKQAHDWPMVMASVYLADGAEIGNGRIVVYGVAPIPWRSEAAEKALKGKKIDRESANAAAEAAMGRLPEARIHADDAVRLDPASDRARQLRQALK